MTREVRTTNEQKVFWPETGTTKGQMIDYYRAVAPVMIPLVSGRAMSLVRFPDGVEGKSFFTKNAPKSRPDWLRTADIWAASSSRTVHYPVIDDVDSLVWAANLGTIEFHVSPARAEDVESPIYAVFDLDPGPPADAVDCARVALLVRDRLSSIGMTALVKSSGSKGLHVVVPLNSGATFEEASEFTRGLAADVEREVPETVVLEMKKNLRRGRVFIDWSQNQRHKTTVAPYSLRARARPRVSAPLHWDEVEEAAETGSDAGLFVELGAVLERIEQIGDPFEELTTTVQRLPEPTGTQS